MTLVRASIIGLALSAQLLAAGLASAATDIVLYSSDLSTNGNWTKVADSTAAGGQMVSSVDNGWSTPNSPLASPSDYVEATFTASASTPYRIWVRLRAGANSKWNDSVWVQFSDSTDASGAAIYRIGSTSGYLENLEPCSGCALSGWGWPNGGYWLTQTSTVQFASSGSHTIRVQIREDGVQLDQIVLSPSTYLSSAPGQPINDLTIVAKTAASSPATSATGPYHGTPAAIPGTIQAEDFDNGGEGVAYHDTTAGNSGGAYRQTDVDIEAASSGGYDVGWFAAGEWMNYSVNVASAGTYTVALRVASPSGGSMHVGFNTASNVWQAVSVPTSGGYQNWTTVSFTATLGAGNQLMTLMSDTGGFNIDSVTVTSGGGSTNPPPPPPSGSGVTVTVTEWNIQVNDSSATHARAAIDGLMASASPSPTIIVMEEAHRSQYATYLSELQAKTGQTWSGVFQTHCPLGDWTGSSCSGSEDEGVGVFTSYPIVDSSTTYFPYADAYHSARAAVRAAIAIGSVTVQVFGVHLQVDNATARDESMTQLKSWSSNYSKPQLAAGDFNADRDQIDISSGMGGSFVDSWSIVGSGNGFTTTTPTPTMKLDYWFADVSGKATPISSSVVTATGTTSDHYPVTAVFRVQP